MARKRQRVYILLAHLRLTATLPNAGPVFSFHPPPGIFISLVGILDLRQKQRDQRDPQDFDQSHSRPLFCFLGSGHHTHQMVDLSAARGPTPLKISRWRCCIPQLGAPYEQQVVGLLNYWVATKPQRLQACNGYNSYDRDNSYDGCNS